MTQENNIEEIFKHMIRDLKEIKDIRGLVLVLHLYIEWWLNLLIKKYFKNHDIILDDNLLNDLKSFSNKVRILNAVGVLDENIFEDIKTVNKIRNIFAHNLDLTHPDVRDKFGKEMEKIRSSEVKETKMSIEDKFSFLAVTLTIELHEIFARPPEH